MADLVFLILFIGFLLLFLVFGSGLLLGILLALLATVIIALASGRIYR